VSLFDVLYVALFIMGMGVPILMAIIAMCRGIPVESSVALEISPHCGEESLVEHLNWEANKK